MLLPPMRMRALPLLLLLAGCMVAQRPPPAPPRAPRFSVEAERQGNADLCRRMADWDCENLDCPDCSSVAERARTRDVGEVAGALAAVGLAAFFAQQSISPGSDKPRFADRLSSGAPPVSSNGSWPATREASEVESCRVTCRRCADTK